MGYCVTYMALQGTLYVLSGIVKYICAFATWTKQNDKSYKQETTVFLWAPWFRERIHHLTTSLYICGNKILSFLSHILNLCYLEHKPLRQGNVFYVTHFSIYLGRIHTTFLLIAQANSKHFLLQIVASSTIAKQPKVVWTNRNLNFEASQNRLLSNSSRSSVKQYYTTVEQNLF